MTTYLSNLAERVREPKYRNQLKRKYPFIKGFRGGRIIFKSVTFGEYVISNMILDTDRMEITQTRSYQRHPHGTVYYDGRRSFCADKSELRELLYEGKLEEAIVEAFLIISSYNPIGAVFRPARSLVCFACGEVIVDHHWDYVMTDFPDKWQAGVYKAGEKQYIVHHYSCQERAHSLIHIRSNENGVS